MLLRQTLIKATNGYWDGGLKQVFDWTIDGKPRINSKGQYVCIGSWDANFWFCVALGKTTKQTLANAKRHLRAITRIESSFEYVN